MRCRTGSQARQTLTPVSDITALVALNWIYGRPMRSLRWEICFHLVKIVWKPLLSSSWLSACVSGFTSLWSSSSLPGVHTSPLWHSRTATMRRNSLWGQQVGRKVTSSAFWWIWWGDIESDNLLFVKVWWCVWQRRVRFQQLEDGWYSFIHLWSILSSF